MLVLVVAGYLGYKKYLYDKEHMEMKVFGQFPQVMNSGYKTRLVNLEQHLEAHIGERPA